MANNITPLPQKKSQGKVSPRKIIYLLFLIIVVVGTVTLVAYHDRINLDNISRMIAYWNISKDSEGTEVSFESHSSNVYSTFENGLAIASAGGFALYHKNGSELEDCQFSMSKPAITNGKTAVAAYDIGGKSLYVARDNGAAALYTLGEDFFITGQSNEAASRTASILSASVNDNGWLALVSREGGYKAIVSVFNSSMEEVYQYRSSSRFITDAVIAPKNAAVAVVSIGQENTRFESWVTFYRLDSKEAYGSYTIPDDLVLSVQYMDESVMGAICESGLYFIEDTGLDKAFYDYSDKYLKNFSFGDGFAALALNRYKAGGRCSLVTVDAEGTEIGNIEFQNEPASVSASGKYVAVLTSDKLYIYTSDLKLYAEFDGIGQARRVIMNSDGTCMLIGSAAAWLYIP